MANYLSPPAEYNQQVIPQYDFNLIGKALAYKQQAIDQNSLAIQEKINQFAQIDLARDVDKKYLGEKVNTLVSHLNSLEGADFSSQNTTQVIQGHISQLLDNNVMTAIASTRNLRKLQSDIDTIKTKSPEKYSTDNEAFAMRGAQAWLSNPNVGAAFQGATYKPYENTLKTMIDIAKDIKDTKGDQVIEVPLRDPQGNLTGYMEKKTIKGLTPEEIQAYLPGLLPSSTLQQLQIDGWAKYQGLGGLQAAQQNFTEYTKQVNSQLDQDIEAAKIGENSTSITKENRDNYANQRQALMQKKENFNSQVVNVNQNDTASLGAFLETNQWLNNFSGMVGKKESIEYENDQTYFNHRNLEVAIARENRQAQESQLSMAKTALEIQKLQGEISPTGGISLSPAVGELAPELNPIDDSYSRYSTLASTVNEITKTVYSQASEDQKKLFDAEKKKLLQQGQTQSNANKLAFDKVFAQSNPREYGILLETQSEKNTVAAGIRKAEDDANVEDFVQNGSDYYNILLTNAKINPNTQKFIQQNGITRENITNANNRDIITKTASYLQDLYNKTPEEYGAALRQEKDPNVRKAIAAASLQRGKFNFKEKNKARASEILKNKGYTGFTTAQAANLTNEADRKLIKNSLSQSSGTSQFDEKQPMTITKNPDGSLMVTQIKEGMKGGGIQSNYRTATIPVGSDLYNNLNKKIQFTAERQVRLNSDTPPKVPRSIGYLDVNATDIVNESADYILATTGGRTLTASNSNPVNYLTSTGTRGVYKTLERIVPAEKLDMLVSLMEANPTKFNVKAEVEKGQWKISTILKGAKPITVSRTDGGNETNSKDINLYVEQFPQITIGESVYKFLSNNPAQVDNLIQNLSQ